MFLHVDDLFMFFVFDSTKQPTPRLTLSIYSSRLASTKKHKQSLLVCLVCLRHYTRLTLQNALKSTQCVLD